ncbi:hypothetical protein SteCoe_20361 [Stentor coeruleus]|uniref:PNPLA domain-containing protein n=1 Tax=Stentor coeruleus TaxID=5963 RepID=A0A1R2BSB8_9CILI|nr:hypothetical protein SteCoe_20361 [Stentor coeruleus]
MAYLLPLSLALLVGTSFGLSDKCYTLSIEGGGTHGAYEAGVLWSFANYIPAEERQWDIITGISAGALNSRMCAQFNYGDEINMANAAINAWESLVEMSMIAAKWKQGSYYSMFFKPSLYNTEPMLDFLNGVCGTTINRNITLGVTDYETGEFAEYNQTIGVELFTVASKASASIPLVFAPTQLEGHWYGDGGVSINLNADKGVSFCRELGYSDSNIVVDLIRDMNGQDRPVSMPMNNSKEVIDRANQISDYYNRRWFLFDFAHSFPNVDTRYVAEPSQQLPPPNGPPLDFTLGVMPWEVELGKADGQKLVVNGMKGWEHLNLKKLSDIPTTHYF